MHLFTSLPVGGAEDLLASIITGLNPHRFAPEVACLGAPGPVGLELGRQGQLVTSLNLDLKRDPFFRILREVRALLRRRQPRILHTHLYHPGLYGRLAAVGLEIPGVVASVHNTYTRPKVHRRLWNYLLARRTQKILVSSSQVYEDVRRYDGVPPEKILMLPYGIPLAPLDLPLTREEAKALLGLSGFCLGSIGRLEEQKGQRYLVAAIPALLRKIPDLQVILVGEGRLRRDLESQVRELGVAPVVHFLGTRRDLPLLYRAMDMFVLPSLWEGLPLVLLQAMAAGLPVVATRVSGVVEVIADGVNGRLIPPADPEALARTVLELCRAPESWAVYGRQARQTVQEHHSLEAMLARLEQLYLDLVT